MVLDALSENVEVSGYSVKDLPVDLSTKLPDDFGSYMFYAKIFAIGFFVFQIAMIIGFFKGRKLAVLLSFIWLIANAIMLFIARDMLFSKLMLVMVGIYAFFTYLHIACLRSDFYRKY
jgi:hypothetical protein